jgi:predicted  nucleic acid-binding Zn-ribbon protein
MGGRFVEDLKSLEDLLELMDLDMTIDKLLDSRSSLPELESYKMAHAEVERITGALETSRGALKDADSGLRRTNGELEIAAEKAASEQNRLYAGGISARDADYLRREVEMLYAKVSKMEDEVLEFIEAKELAEADVARLSDDLANAVEEKETLGSSITEQWRLIDKELAVKEERKKTTATLVDAYLLEVYDDLRATGMGRVVGRLSDDTCGACHLRLSAAEIAKALKQDPPRCIHCRAILVG